MKKEKIIFVCKLKFFLIMFKALAEMSAKNVSFFRTAFWRIYVQGNGASICTYI